MIAQIEHIPELLRLGDRSPWPRERPSPAARAFVADTFGVPAVATVEELWTGRSTPSSSPRPTRCIWSMSWRLRRGLHVLCEKPLCYGTEDIDRLIAARDHAGRVGQVAYMKRFDPSYEAALRLLPGTRRSSARLGGGATIPTPGRSSATIASARGGHRTLS